MSSTEISSSWREQTTQAGWLLHPSTVLLSCSPCTPLRNGDPASMPAASQHRQRHHSSIKAESCRIPPDPPQHTEPYWDTWGWSTRGHRRGLPGTPPSRGLRRCTCVCAAGCRWRR